MFGFRPFSSEDRIHSTDIAFKPAESGWGASSKYSRNFDEIFGQKNDDQEKKSNQGGNEKQGDDNSLSTTGTKSTTVASRNVMIDDDGKDS